jgi:acetolactate synthase-1/2/3 large subunit
MNGAESLARTLLACGVDTVFANPGTSEMHFVSALDRVPGIRCVLATFEGVVTAAADGYARMAGKPAATLLHCGPGLGNGLANLHNAHRANSPVVNIVGDQATYHKPLNPLLAADTEGFARGVSAWVRTATRAGDVGRLAAEAVAAATSAPGDVATLILPSDASWNDGGIVAAPIQPVPPRTVPDEALAGIAKILRSGEPTVIMLAGRTLRAGALANAHRIAAATGARLAAETFIEHIERGRGRFDIERVPYVIDPAVEFLAGTRHLVLINAHDPVGFFAYPGKPGRMAPPDATVHVLARPEDDGPDVLARLADLLGCPPVPPPRLAKVEAPRGATSPAALARALAALLPEHAIVVDESITMGAPLYSGTAAAAPHDWLQLTGGAIGIGIPLATGAAVGAPGGRVVNLQADGSALYTLQGLWTQARESLDVTTVILSNRTYAILFAELAGVGATRGPASNELFSLAGPAHDWISLAKGFGVEAARAETMESFAELFTSANRRKGPFLIELLLS